MKIHCKYDKLITVEEAMKLFHPKNVNVHPQDQIDRLADILEYQGMRYAIKVSNLSGKITSGHGRVLGISTLVSQKRSENKVPVVYQEYESEEQEIADIVADNSIASWASLDFTMINANLADFNPEFNLDLLGIKNFNIDGGSFIEDIEVNNEINEAYNFIIKCDDYEELDKIRKIFNSDGSKITFDKAYECLNH